MCKRIPCRIGKHTKVSYLAWHLWGSAVVVYADIRGGSVPTIIYYLGSQSQQLSEGHHNYDVARSKK